jgi:hypothetical protein
MLINPSARTYQTNILYRAITKLSELGIDKDKDWGGAFGIENLKELATGMTKGDIVFFGSGGVLKKISPGPLTDFLTCNGPLHELTFEAPPH